MVKRSLPPMRHTRHMEEMRALKRQRTTTRKNPFFEQLNYDVRRAIYDHLTLSPFVDAKRCAGLYLSCKQFKNEMDQAASVKLRNHLLSHQKAIAKKSDGRVHIQLPKEVEIRPVPTDTVMDISITIHSSVQPLEISRWMFSLHEMLSSIKINQLQIHIILPPDCKYTEPDAFPMHWVAIASELLHRVIGPPYRKPVMRVGETIMTWRAAKKTSEKASEGNTSPEALIEGHKFQLANATPQSPYSYCFFQNGMEHGAWVFINPNPFKQRQTVSTEEFDMLTAYDSHGDRFNIEFSKATMNLTTLEISDGEKGVEEDAGIGPMHSYFHIEDLVTSLTQSTQR